MKKTVITLFICGLIATLYGLAIENQRFITGGLVFTTGMIGSYLGNCLKDPQTGTGRKRSLLRGVLLAETLCLTAMLTLIATSATGHTDLPAKLILILAVSSVITLAGMGYILHLLKSSNSRISIQSSKEDVSKLK
ncbi:MAG: hypothetical protein NC388_05230 [Clostridium sp.]|nr:hypothetical protein [Clostridium sp.]